MGVFYLLFYLLGAALVTFGATELAGAVLEGEGWSRGLTAAGLGGLVIAGGGLLQALVARRRGGTGLLETLSPMRGRTVVSWLGLYLGSIVAAWVQFELYAEPVHMFPFLTVPAALAVVFGLATRVLRTGRLRGVWLASSLALVGLPVGLLGVVLPAAHFNHHLSSVKFVLTDPHTHESREVTLPADAPNPPEAEVALGEETLGFLHALANAKEVDVAEELAAGRMLQLEDGRYVIVDEDGRERPVEAGAAEKLTEQLGLSVEADTAAGLQKYAAQRELWEREMERRRRAGRLFSRPEEGSRASP